MSATFEIESDSYPIPGRWLVVNANRTHCFVHVGSVGDTTPWAEFRREDVCRLRRFLEWCYPPSDDPPHDVDPWVKPDAHQRPTGRPGIARGGSPAGSVGVDDPDAPTGTISCPAED